MKYGTSGVNIINVLRAAFACKDHKIAKKTVFLVLSGSAVVKAARKMLVKSTPDVRGGSRHFAVHKTGK